MVKAGSHARRARHLGTVTGSAKTFTLSDTGTFSKDMFSVGKDGVTNSPLSHGEISALRLDDLDLGRLLGKGASSRVYLATHRRPGRPLALKVLQDLEREQAARHSLVSEMKVVFNALSDHLVGFYDAFLHEGAVYLALEYMDAGSLLDVYENAAARCACPSRCSRTSSSRSCRGSPTSTASATPSTATSSRRTSCSTLRALVKLSDFGAPRALLSRRAIRSARNSACAILTRVSSAGISKQLDSTRELAESYCGTRVYMSPERTKGEPYGLASDVWSFGLLALEARVRPLPVPGGDVLRPRVAHRRRPAADRRRGGAPAALARAPRPRARVARQGADRAPRRARAAPPPADTAPPEQCELQRYLTAALQAGMAAARPTSG